MTVIRFTLAGAPVTTNQGYRPAVRNGRPGFILTDEGEAYKARLALAARAAHRAAGSPPAIEHGAIVAVRFVFPTLGTDIDGPTKFVLDATSVDHRHHDLGAPVVANDTRVRHVVLRKADPDGRPRTEVAIAGPGAPCCPTCGCACGLLGEAPAEPAGIPPPPPRAPRKAPARSAAGDNLLALITTKKPADRAALARAKLRPSRRDYR